MVVLVNSTDEGKRKRQDSRIPQPMHKASPASSTIPDSGVAGYLHPNGECKHRDHKRR